MIEPVEKNQPHVIYSLPMIEPVDNLTTDYIYLTIHCTNILLYSKWHKNQEKKELLEEQEIKR